MNNYIDKTNMIGLGIACDNCGRTVQGITYVNGMKFCAKCYQETFGKQEDFKTAHYTEHLEQEDAQLKQQLSEKDKKLNKLRHEICEKIRKELDKYEHITWVLVRDILDQIDKGEE